RPDMRFSGGDQLIGFRKHRRRSSSKGARTEVRLNLNFGMFMFGQAHRFGAAVHDDEVLNSHTRPWCGRPNRRVEGGHRHVRFLKNCARTMKYLNFSCAIRWRLSCALDSVYGGPQKATALDGERVSTDLSLRRTRWRKRHSLMCGAPVQRAIKGS